MPLYLKSAKVAPPTSVVKSAIGPKPANKTVKNVLNANVTPPIDETKAIFAALST